MKAPSPRVVGIDGWAWQRSQTYGTTICELERHGVIDLLPGRSAEPLRNWLAAHPSITVISRDCSGSYADPTGFGRRGRAGR